MVIHQAPFVGVRPKRIRAVVQNVLPKELPRKPAGSLNVESRPRPFHLPHDTRRRPKAVKPVLSSPRQLLHLHYRLFRSYLQHMLARCFTSRTTAEEVQALVERTTQRLTQPMSER